MDTGQTVFIISQLVLGAAASFFAILFWPKTRDAAWMLIIIGVIVTYIETVYSILKVFGIGIDDSLHIGSVPVIPFILPTLRTILFIIAFAVMIHRQTRQK